MKKQYSNATFPLTLINGEIEHRKPWHAAGASPIIASAGVTVIREGRHPHRFFCHTCWDWREIWDENNSIILLSRDDLAFYQSFQLRS